jgi:hypothetical protein
MAAPRPKITYYLDDAEHRALKVLADAEGLSQIEWTEKVIKEAISQRVRAASLLANELQRAGIIGNHPESAGITGKGQR